RPRHGAGRRPHCAGRRAFGMLNDRLMLALARRFARHRWQALLSALGVALGVGVVVAVDLANHSARSSFDASLQQIAGRATHRIIGARGLDERLYASLRQSGLRRAAPVVEGGVRLRGEFWTLLGFEPLAEAAFRGWAPPLNSSAMRDLLTRDGAVLLPAPAARRLGLGIGDTANITVAGIAKPVRIAGLVALPGGGADGLLLADISTAQQLLGSIGRLDRIDLILDAREAGRVSKLLPAGARLVAAQTRARAALGKPFQTNLAAMSLLALLVGGFFIHNAMRFSVLQRRELLGSLRMLGATRAQLFTRILAEALALGLAGALAGLLAGVWLARALLGLVERTINDLYFASAAGGLLLPPQVLWKGLALGLALTLLAALLPALEAARASPLAAARRSMPEMRARRALPKWALAGGGVMLAGGALVAWPSDAVLPGFVALFFLLIGFCLAAPQLALMLSRVCAPLFALLFGFGGRFAARGVGAGLSRTGPALSALTLAVAATIGIGVMVESFRGAVDGWLRHSLPGDLYLSIPANSSKRAATPLPPGFADAVRALPGVAALSAGRRVEVETAAGAVTLHAVEFAFAPDHYAAGFHFTRSLPRLWHGFARGEMILISEPYAFHHKLRAGDAMELLAGDGARRFIVGGIFRDYASERGALVIARAAYARWWGDRAISTIGVYFANADADAGAAGDGDGDGDGDRDAAATDAATTAAAVTRQIKTLAAAHDPRIRVRANREIRGHSLRIFERTFAITRVLRWLVMVVAFVGILSALLALQLERARENAVLRACGCTRRDVFALGVLQTGVIGLFAGLLALPLGWLVAQLLIQVINPRSFGWTLVVLPAPAVYFEALALALGAALLAGVYPSWRMARASPAAALREE
ncbi:MAG: ABC transporter permease, partial [Gammaproteobacteria bacterium]